MEKIIKLDNSPQAGGAKLSDTYRSNSTQLRDLTCHRNDRKSEITKNGQHHPKSTFFKTVKKVQKRGPKTGPKNMLH